MILFRRNNKYYYIKFKTDAGKEIRFSTKKKFKHEALRVLSELKSNPKKMKKKKKGISFKKCKKLYLDESKHAHSYRYFDVLNRSLRLFETHVGNLELKKIDRIMVTTFINGFLEENRVYPANQHFRNLRTFFNWTVVNQFVKESPVKGLKAPKIPEKT